MADPRSGIVAIIDDDAAILDSLKFLLEVFGHRVATYASAAAFLCESGPLPGCLILDHNMPGMTGLELAAQLRQDDVVIPVLLITGAPSPAVVARAATLGVVRVLEKPADEADLLDFIGRHC